MKRHLAFFSAVVFLGLAIFTLACCLKPMLDWRRAGAPCLVAPCDFSLRLNEIDCLLTGVNPFDVWHGDLEHPPFCPHNRPESWTEAKYIPVNAYAPWEYSVMMPLAWLPRSSAWAIYFILMFGALGILVYGGYVLGKSWRGDVSDALFMAILPVLLAYYPIWSNFCIGNFTIFVLAAVWGLCWCLNRGHDVWAGACWAIAMLKPQLGVLFAVPLLLRRRFVTCAIAAGLCVAFSLPATLISGTSLVDLIMQTPAANVFCFNGCGTYPYLLCSGPGDEKGVIIGLLVGCLADVALTWHLRKVRDWFVYMMPTAVCVMCWTYVQAYSHAMCLFFYLVLVSCLLKNPRRVGLWVLMGLSLFCMPRVYTCWHNALAAFGQWDAWGFSEELHRTVESLLSTCSLLLMAYFTWRSGRLKDEIVIDHTVL